MTEACGVASVRSATQGPPALRRTPLACGLPARGALGLVDLAHTGGKGNP